MNNRVAPVNVTISKNYDSEFCGSIPLHLVNLIQPHGMLFVLEKEELRIVQVSENVTQFLSNSTESLLNHPLSNFVPTAQFQDLQAKMAQLESHDRLPVTLTFTTAKNDSAFTAIIHPEDDYILIELEEVDATDQDVSFIKLYQQTKYITSLLKQAGTKAETSQIAADEIKKMTGFDRVLVYQFDPKWNGIVIAQAKEDDMDDFMGLRFPASDVPKQARDLYFRNPYRLIPTRNYTPVRMVPVLNPLTQKFTDLSDCNLRSVASVHLEYLKNMGISGSMSLPIIIDNKLWGLISCHHRADMNPAYELRSSLELLSDIIATQIAAKERESAIGLKAQLSEVHARLLEQLYNSPNFANGLFEGSLTVSHLLSLSGTALRFDGKTQLFGETPNQQEVDELLSWLRRNSIEQIYTTDNLTNDYPRGVDFAEKASGLIAIPINAEQGEYILGFRAEVLQTVNWGGNPDDAIQMEPDGKSYHPRNSFATYKQIVKHTSQPWLLEEIEAAEKLRSAVLEKIIRDRY